MSFAKFMIFKTISFIGAILACLGGVLIAFLLTILRASPLFSIGLLSLSIFMLTVGIVIYCYGAFKERAEQIKKGIQKKEEHAF
jgi:predicted membrane channel-forming protein YqfA (hemolysin III family)